MMAALTLFIDTAGWMYLVVLAVMLIETLWADRHRIKKTLQAFSLRAWCSTPSTWLASILARLERM